MKHRTKSQRKADKWTKRKARAEWKGYYCLLQELRLKGEKLP